MNFFTLAMLMTAAAAAPTFSEVAEEVYEMIKRADVHHVSGIAGNQIGAPKTSPLCEDIQGVLNGIDKNCKCVDTAYTEDKQKGIEIQCIRYVKLIDDHIGWKLKIQPCTEPMNIHLTLHGDKLIHDLDLPGIKANIAHSFPIPGASAFIPGADWLGQVGLTIPVTISGNPSELSIQVGIDACAKILGHGVCASNLPLLNKLFGAHIGPGMDAFKGAFQNLNIPAIPIPGDYCGASAQPVVAAPSTAVASPADLPRSSMICVRNSAWFAMNFKLHSDELDAESGNAAKPFPYTVGKSKCLSGRAIGPKAAAASKEFKMYPVVDALLGKTQRVQPAVVFDTSAPAATYYECSGTTLNYECELATPKPSTGLQVAADLFDFTLGFTEHLVGDVIGITACAQSVFDILKTGLSPLKMGMFTLKETFKKIKDGWKTLSKTFSGEGAFHNATAANVMQHIADSVNLIYGTIMSAVGFQLWDLVHPLLSCVNTGIHLATTIPKIIAAVALPVGEWTGEALATLGLDAVPLLDEIFDTVASFEGKDYTGAGRHMGSIFATILKIILPGI